MRAGFPAYRRLWAGGTERRLYGADTYTAQATVGDVKKGIENHKVPSKLYSNLVSRLTHVHAPQNLESSEVSLLVFGNGDGGGGPLAKMLENVSDLFLRFGDNLPNSPWNPPPRAVAAHPSDVQPLTRHCSREHGPLRRRVLRRPRGGLARRCQAAQLERRAIPRGTSYPRRLV